MVGLDDLLRLKRISNYMLLLASPVLTHSGLAWLEYEYDRRN